MKIAWSLFTAFVVLPAPCIAWPRTPPLKHSQAQSAAKTAVEHQAANEGRQNRVKPTPENLAEAKKFFGYDCAMCHGANGDGKGDLAASMGLKMNDWRESSRLESLSDNEMFDLIVKGKGKMIGEGDRYPAETVWELVNYVREFSKKETAASNKPGPSH